MARAGEAAIVRALALAEWPLLREIRLRALADAPDAFGRTVEEERRRPDAAWEAQLARSVGSESTLIAVAERAGEAVGFVHAQLHPGEPRTVELYGMWVAPAARRAGAGRALVDAIAAWARSRGATRLVLNVTQGDFGQATPPASVDGTAGSATGIAVGNTHIYYADARELCGGWARGLGVGRRRANAAALQPRASENSTTAATRLLAAAKASSYESSST